jgi:hypothetical protein
MKQTWLPSLKAPVKSEKETTMLKFFLAALAILFSSGLSSAQTVWEKSTEIYTNPDNSKYPTGIFISSYIPSYGPPAGQWTQVDLKPYGVSADAKAVFLSGILIITHGTLAQTCDLSVTLRAPGSTLVGGAYLGQTVEAHIGGGQRSTMGTWVPVENGIFEIHWGRSTFGQYPSECTYGVNLSLQAWVK